MWPIVCFNGGKLKQSNAIYHTPGAYERHEGASNYHTLFVPFSVESRTLNLAENTPYKVRNMFTPTFLSKLLHTPFWCCAQFCAYIIILSLQMDDISHKPCGRGDHKRKKRNARGRFDRRKNDERRQRQANKNISVLPPPKSTDIIPDSSLLLPKYWQKLSDIQYC